MLAQSSISECGILKYLKYCSRIVSHFGQLNLSIVFMNVIYAYLILIIDEAEPSLPLLAWRTEKDRMLVQHTLPWHRRGFVLLAFHLWVQRREEKERLSFPGLCCGLCHPLNIEQNSAKRHSNSDVKIDAVLPSPPGSCLLWYMGFSGEAVTRPWYKTVPFLV